MIDKKYLYYLITEIINEGVVDKILDKDPELKKLYNHVEKGHVIKQPSYLFWVYKNRGEYPLEEAAKTLQLFANSQQRLKAKGLKTDLNAYTSLKSIEQALASLGLSRKEEKEKIDNEETSFIGNFGEWSVVMPHTRESSIRYGKDTTWCTSSTQSANLFLLYTANNENNTILYYVIKNKANPREEPTSKLSIGVIDEEIRLEGQYGGVSVDASNKGLDEKRLSSILGDQYQPILDAIAEHSLSIGDNHPARKQLEQIATSTQPSIIDIHTKGMNENQKDSFFALLVVKDISKVMAQKVMSMASFELKKKLASHRYVAYLPQNIIDSLINDEDVDIREELASNRYITDEISDKLSNDKEPLIRDIISQNRLMERWNNIIGNKNEIT